MYQYMNTERLEWLPLSSPPAPPAGPPTAGSPEAAARACPTCGWPLAPGTVVCSHCGGSPSDDPLAGLDIQLPQRVVEVMPPPDRWFDGETALDPPALYDLRLRAERMHTTTGFDRLICLDDISVDHYEHQLEAALRALRDMRGRALLADEVGLGKTIEAGIVMKELIERGLVASVLILVPAPLTWQWHEEMLTKFHEDFVVLEDVEQLEAAAPATRLIISLDRAKSNGWSERLLAREYDMLIVDEAHKLKNRATQVYRFVDAIRKRYVLMLTATPVHNDLEELYNLVTILRPGHLGTRRAFRRDFVAHAGPRRRVVTWSSQAYGVATYINKANSEILTTEYLNFRPEMPDKALSLDELLPPPLSSADDWVHKVEPKDLANFAQAKSELTELLHQGYRIDHARLVRYKDNNIYGFRVELSKSIVETETKGTVVASTSLPTKTKHLPPRRNIYTRYWNWPPHSYLRKSHEARRAYRQDEATSSWILKRIENFSDLDISKLKPEDQKEAEEIRQLIDRGYEVVDFEAVEWIGQNFTWDKQSEGLRTDFVCRLKLKPQPRRPRPRKRAPRDERHTTPRNPSALRGLLQEVMIRNRRSSVSVRFPPRKASVYTLALTPPERALYDGVTAYIRERLQSPSPSGRGAPAGRGEGTLRLTLMTLQRQLCSSPQAVARTLEKLVEREADPRLAEYLTLARSIEQGRKVAATQIILEQYPGKFLIFTDYLPTLHALRAALDRAGHETVVYHGGLSPRERVETVRAFRLSARVMISTQSGGEGHNLQFCHQMINYDLPWNPMRIEQRIGRIHRLGQQHEVAIFNLSAADTIEAYVLDLLARKIRMFELVIGELDLILGALDDERGFEDYVREAWAGSRSEAELLRKIAELEALIAGARHTYEQIRTASDELSEWAGE
jgi:superfamily II DNA or RNA helicase